MRAVWLPSDGLGWVATGLSVTAHAGVLAAVLALPAADPATPPEAAMAVEIVVVAAESPAETGRPASPGDDGAAAPPEPAPVEDLAAIAPAAGPVAPAVEPAPPEAPSSPPIPFTLAPRKPALEVAPEPIAEPSAPVAAAGPTVDGETKPPADGTAETAALPPADEHPDVQSEAGSGLGASRVEAGVAAGHPANRPPRYPRLARQRGEEGRVLLEVAVNADGRPESVTVKRSSGHPLLDRAASKAVRDWAFEPARLDGRAIAGRVEVPIRFRLTDE